MEFIRKILWLTVNFFFAVYFRIFGKPVVSKNLQKSIDLYKGNNFTELFSLIRVWDAPYEEINELVPKSGKIIDLGSGDGILANYLSISSSKRKIIGIEINTNRLKEADKGIKNVKFEKGDIVKGNYPKADCIILSHVLHHLPNRKDQEKVLKVAKKRLKKGGKLIIVEIVERPLSKHVFTWITDAFIVPILFEGKLFDFNFHYRKESEWIDALEDLRFGVKINKPHIGKPFSHIAFDCELK